MFTKKQNRRNKAIAIGAFAFLIAPAGFAGSLIIGSAAAIITAAYDACTAAKTSDIELMEDEDFRAVADGATLIGLCGFIMAIPNPIGPIGTLAKLAGVVLIRRVWYYVITKEGRTPNFNKYWEFKFRADDYELKLKF